MVLLLWFAAALLPSVYSNAYFPHLTVGYRSPDVVYKIGSLENLAVKEYHIKEAYAWFTENTCVNMIDYRDAPAGAKIDLPIHKNPVNDSCAYADNYFQIGNCISSRPFIIHETMHFLGFYHTQNRPDWRKYMSPLEGYNYNFDVPTCKAVPSVPYDYGSVMHYEIPGVKLIDDQFLPTMAQTVRVPFSDAKSINWLYNCSGHCTTNPKCLNGGYTHPRDCNKCMCNKYYTGTLCETPRNLIKLSCQGKPNHYREIRINGDQEADQKKLLIDDFFDHHDELWDIIEAPQNTEIWVEIRAWGSSGSGLPSVRCNRYAVELNDGDMNTVGKMFCDSWVLGKNVWHNFTAKSNRLGLHMEHATQIATTLIARFSLKGCDGSLHVTTTTTSSTTTTAVPSTTTTQIPTTTSTPHSSPPTTTLTTTVPPVTTTTKPEEVVCEY